jgi:hypothetical protein
VQNATPVVEPLVVVFAFWQTVPPPQATPALHSA